MKLIALCGAAGAGKDTVADMLPARKLAFADTLYAEVAAAWGVSVGWLKDRYRKGVPQDQLRISKCRDEIFWDFMTAETWIDPRSPRQILQWWGDYRRAQDPEYFVTATHAAILDHIDYTPISKRPVVITDVRFPNEAAMVRQLGGQIWQIKRPGYEAGGTGHASDTDGSEFGPDRVIYNDMDLLTLRQIVDIAWEGL